MRHPRLVLFLTLALASTAAASDTAVPASPPPAHNPLYPLWENTGLVLRDAEFFVGTAFLQAGLPNGLQVGLRPISFFFRAPNMHVKWGFYESARLSAAVQVEGVLLLKGASEAFTSSNFVSRLDNTEADLGVMPINLSSTWSAQRWLRLHGTLTAMTVWGGGTFQNAETFGATGVAELSAARHHTLSFHVGEVGFWNHDFSLLGAEYRYQRGGFEARLGYFFRFTEDGRQGAPMLAIGMRL